MGVYHKNALPAGFTLAEYQIESVLGHGGFGITYLARDTALGAHVAVKEYLPHEIAVRDPQTSAIMPKPTREAVRDYHVGLKNFVKEARALAKFKHPNIVRVLRFLESNGTAYVVMEYEKGMSLADHLKESGQRLEETQLLRIFIPILNGLHAVHEAQMLHLDIKPENIYLRHDGNPMLIDFGSARQAIASGGHGQRIALTHGYAPMEQYPDKGKPGPATDIYALGASMYRCVTGKKPDNALDRYQAVLKYTVDPLLPATKAAKKKYRENLLQCIDWAMQIYAQDRPQSARVLQDALMGKMRAPEKVLGATSINPVTIQALRTPKHGKPGRGRFLTFMFSADRGAVLTLTLVALIGALVFYWNDVSNFWLEKRAPVQSGAPVREARPASVEAKTDAAIKPPTETRPVSADAMPISSALPTKPGMTLAGHKDWVQSVAFSPNGKWLASAGNDKAIRIWEAKTGKLVATWEGERAPTNAVAFSPDSKRLITAGNDGSVKAWDLQTGKVRRQWQSLGTSVYALSVSPDGKWVAAAGRDRTVFVWDADNGKRLAAIEGHGGDIYALSFSPDGTRLASAGADRVVRVWNPRTGEALQALQGHKDQVLTLSFSPDGQFLASGDAGHSIRVWSALNGALVRTVSDSTHAILSLAYAPDGRWLAVGSADNSIRFFDVRDGAVLHTVNAHRDHVQSVALSPDGKLLASGSRDTLVKLWKVN